MQKINDVLRLFLSVIICFMASAISEIFTTPAISTWYAKLVKPPFTPPDSVFGLVWFALYLMMGISLFFIWSKISHYPKKRYVLIIFAIQLILNVFWSIMFFGLKSPFIALIDIGFLWIFIIATIIAFYRISHISSYLLIPYFLWVSFASVLNYYFYILNR